MCTVTFIPTATGAFICSNRDEKRQRGIAHPPQTYTHDGTRLIYPKDPDASGTWVLMKESGEAAVLLNGAFKDHEAVYPYRRSRGLVLLDIAASADMNEAFLEIDLEGIEPFTLVLYKPGLLTVGRWDGSTRHFTAADHRLPSIWSSATLYTPDIVLERQQWFTNWLSANCQPKLQDVLHFHRFGGHGNTGNSIRMNRQGELLTVSITCLEILPDAANIHYYDLRNNEQSSVPFKFSQAIQLNS